MNKVLSNSELLGAILETIAALVVVMDDEGRVVLFNAACEELTGYQSEEVEGQPIWDLLVPLDSRPTVEAAFESLRAGNFPSQYESDWLTRAGGRRIIEWSNSALTDESGAVEYIIATGVDITKRRQAEEQQRELIRSRAARRAAEAARDSLRVSESVFSGIVDLCADAIISIGQDQNITLFNQGAEEIFGYRADEVLGQPLKILLPSHARDSHHKHVEEFSHGERPSQRMGERGEIYGMRKNGERFPAEASISKQKVEGKWIYTAVLRDVTEQRKAEEELERTNLELKRSNGDLEHFAAVASHDLQEPLRKIQAFGERLQTKYGDELPERGQDYLGRMQNAAGRMSALIQDLLAFSRVTTRAQPFESVDLKALVEKAVSDLEVRIERSGGTVEIGELPSIDADAMQMHLLFQNLIGNGLKFHRQDVPPVVSVTAEIDKQLDKPVCRILVQDNGVGFDEKYLDRIFDVFQRLHGRGVYEGTGMGLAIVRKIVERHDGSITAQSRPGEGARFIIHLPLVQTHAYNASAQGLSIERAHR